MRGPWRNRIDAGRLHTVAQYGTSRTAPPLDDGAQGVPAVRVRRRHGEKLLYRLALKRITTQMRPADGRRVRLNRWLRRLVFDGRVERSTRPWRARAGYGDRTLLRAFSNS